MQTQAVVENPRAVAIRELKLKERWIGGHAEMKVAEMAARDAHDALGGIDADTDPLTFVDRHVEARHAIEAAEKAREEVRQSLTKEWESFFPAKEPAKPAAQGGGHGGLGPVRSF
ncbi:MAG: hypothetical protein HY744_13020 [Deltaproteobacteria bacterium]|nr:hypothetical protein [Deltaproteobacteria bacterium]